MTLTLLLPNPGRISPCRSLYLLVLGFLLGAGAPTLANVTVKFPGPMPFTVQGEAISATSVSFVGIPADYLAVGTGNGFLNLVKFLPGVENFLIAGSIHLDGRLTWIGPWEDAPAPTPGIVVAMANPDQLVFLSVLAETPYFIQRAMVDLPEDPGTVVFVGDGPAGGGEVVVSLPGIDQVAVVSGSQDTWEITRQLGTGDNPYSLAALDLDGDGVLEFVSGDRGVLSGSVGVFQRDAAGEFTLISHYALDGGVSLIAAMDVADPPGTDLLVANSDSARVFVLGWEAGALTELDRFALTLPPDYMSLARLHDGSVGLYTAIEDRGLAEFYHLDGGNWSRVESYYPGCMPVNVTTCDFNGDGIRDLVCLGGLAKQGTVLFGNPAFIYWGFPALALNSVPGPSDLADYTGDGLPDLLVAGYNKPVFSIFPGEADGGFYITPREQDLDFFAGTMTSFDANGDTQTDIAVVDLLVSEIRVMIYTESDTFATVTTLLPGMVPSSLAHADLDLDGNQDIYLARPATSDILIAYGDGTGQFDAQIQVPILTGVAGVLAVDLNGDNLKELVVSDGIGRVWSLLNQGARQFAEGSWVNVGAGPRELLAVDLDQDQDLDVVVANRYDQSLTFMENNGQGELLLRVGNHGLSGEPIGLACGDMNLNGEQDIVVNLGAEGNIGVVFGLGDWVFTPVNRFAAGVNITGFNVGDFNVDGILDVLSMDQTLNLGLIMLNVERALVSVDPAALGVECVDGDLRLQVVPDRSGPWTLQLEADGQRVTVAENGYESLGKLDYDQGSWYLTLPRDSWIDLGLPPGTRGLTARLGVGEPGRREFLDLALDKVCAPDRDRRFLPTLTWDRQPWPNPFNPLVKCRISLARPSRVLATIHDTAGRRVATLMAGDLGAGSHELVWDGRQDGRPAPAGIYLLRVRTDEGVLGSKVLLLK